MELDNSLILIMGGFIILTLASSQVGQLFARLKLPLISGFLLAGILVGPYVLGFIPESALDNLVFIDELSLAFIAFAAGSELYLKEMHSRLRSISWVTLCNAFFVPLLGSITVFYLSGLISFMSTMPVEARFAVSVLAGAILIARSPSSAIAIVNELRARGPFTQTVLGVTMISDVVVILVFAVNSEMANALLTDVQLNVGFLVLLLAELLLSALIGILVGKLLQFILSLTLNGRIKAILILLAGYFIFWFSGFLREYSHENWPVEILLEPLFICMVAGFLVTNFGRYRPEFLKILQELAPPIYVIFFTLTGASLALDTLADTWIIALILVGVRLIGIFIGSFTGGVIAKDPMLHNRVSWLTYVTQAGVGLGLAKEVAVEFPDWGSGFATMIIATVVVNQLIGPPLFKWAIQRVGEAHTRHESRLFDGIRDALIFGIDNQSIALAHQLMGHGWQVRIACLDPDILKDAGRTDLDIQPINQFTPQTLRELGAENADAIVTMLTDEENYQISDIAYEHFGTKTLVVRLNNRGYSDRFRQLGALIVDPATAMVGLLDHFVRSPSAASLLLGMDAGQDVVDIEIRNKDLHGLTLRELRLPLDTLILSVQRDGQTIISHGFTELHLGDRVTVVGSVESLDQVMLRFDTQNGLQT